MACALDHPLSRSIVVILDTERENAKILPNKRLFPENRPPAVGFRYGPALINHRVWNVTFAEPWASEYFAMTVGSWIGSCLTVHLEESPP